MNLISFFLMPPQLPRSDDSGALYLRGGLLLRRLQPADAGLYTCTGHERRYRQVLARYRLQVVPSHGLLRRTAEAPPPVSPATVTSDLAGVGHYCERLWYQREKRRQHKLQLKLKLSRQHEGRKARVRRNYWTL